MQLSVKRTPDVRTTVERPLLPMPRRRAWGHGVTESVRKVAENEKDWSGCVRAIAVTRDKQEFAALFGHFAPRLKSFFMRLGVPSGGAEDLAQEVMFAVWRKAAYFDPERASASTWIFTIARNLRIDLKRRERDPRLLDGLNELSLEPGPGESVMARQSEERVRAAMKTLPADQATVIRLSFFEDRPHGEIAELLGIPLGTVKSRVRLAMSRLRASMGDLA
jgi:RNA polymerase sigma-70 factor (ECF subfamily)